MNNKQARKTGHTIEVCGCVMIIMSQLWLGLAMFAVGLFFVVVMGRCPHCHKVLLGTAGSSTNCPRCHNPL